MEKIKTQATHAVVSLPEEGDLMSVLYHLTHMLRDWYDNGPYWKIDCFSETELELTYIEPYHEFDEKPPYEEDEFGETQFRSVTAMLNYYGEIIKSETVTAYIVNPTDSELKEGMRGQEVEYLTSVCFENIIGNRLPRLRFLP